MESLGGNENGVDRTLAQTMAFGYFGILLLIGTFGMVDNASVKQSIVFSDSCNYTDYNEHLCGDICVSSTDHEYCDCGGNRLSIGKYCCASPSVNCTRTPTGARCAEGEVKDFYESPFC